MGKALGLDKESHIGKGVSLGPGYKEGLALTQLLGSPRERHFDSLIYLIRNKLSGWRANSFSFVGSLIVQATNCNGFTPLEKCLRLD